MACTNHVLYLHPNDINHAHQPSYRHLQVVFSATSFCTSFYVSLQFNQFLFVSGSAHKTQVDEAKQGRKLLALLYIQTLT